MRCDLCGNEGKLYKTKIEGTELNVCSGCASHGMVLEEVKEPVIEERMTGVEIKEEVEEEAIELIVSDFSEKIRKNREELGLNQEDFAKRISEKESVIHKLENGSLEPSLDLARKLERLFGIKLVEEYKESHENTGTTETGAMTIADMIKIKKKAR
ncbi:TIGR00270 family protein [Candidatus Woesearchaeota archaeon]|nr:TIGR00270 family protein [Candidatus Woesearchaeota archaeon]